MELETTEGLPGPSVIPGMVDSWSEIYCATKTAYLRKVFLQ